MDLKDLVLAVGVGVFSVGALINSMMVVVNIDNKERRNWYGTVAMATASVAVYLLKLLL